MAPKEASAVFLQGGSPSHPEVGPAGTPVKDMLSTRAVNASIY
jgi:hypothetical protein